MDPIVTTELPIPIQLREPSDQEILAAGEALKQLGAEARALGHSSSAASVHYAMGRIWLELLGDQKSAAICYQNAFTLKPDYRPNLEAARRLFASAAHYQKVLALHQREEKLLRDPAQRAESLRAQATVLLRDLGQPAEAARMVREALELAPDHPALLMGAVAAASKDGDRLLCAKLLLRSAAALRDDVQRAQLLRRAVLLLEELIGESAADDKIHPPTEPWRATPAELDKLLEEAARKLHSAELNDPVGSLALLTRARAANDWEAVLRLCRDRAERTGSTAERALVANLAAHRLGRAAEGLAEVKAALEDNRRDGALLALQAELSELQRSPDLADHLRARADSSLEASERAHLKIRAAALLQDPIDREHLLSEALSEDPGDAAAIAQHTRLVAVRDPLAAAERFTALGEALLEHAPGEAAGHFLEAGAWLERAGQREEAVAAARRALLLVPLHPAALRLLQRTLPLLGGTLELAALLEEAASQLPRAVAAELLVRAASLLSDQPAEFDQDPSQAPNARALVLVQRAAELARGLTSPRWTEAWTSLALRTGDLSSLAFALEHRAEALGGADAADLLVEAAELSRAVGDDERVFQLLRKATKADPQSSAARLSLLALPTLPAAERTDLLAEEARLAEPERASALHAERAALFEESSRPEEAVQACAQAIALGGADLAVLRRLARLQLRRGDHLAALAVLVQIAQAVPEGNPRAEAYGRAAEVAEWRVGDPRRAIDLYRAAATEHPGASFALANLGRLLAWTGRYPESAEVFERLGEKAEALSEQTEAWRWAASLNAHRASQPAKAAQLYRKLLEGAPGDLEAMAELLALIGNDHGREARKERAELRGKIASRCQDPRVAALLRSESAEDRLAAGERDQGIAEYRRALALNPQDRNALDVVEEALRSSGQKQLLAEHLAFRCAYADGETRTALALQQAEIYAEQGDTAKASAAYQQALASDPGSLLAVRGARRMAEELGEKSEVMRLLAREAALSHDPGLAAGSLVEAALLAVDMGDTAEAVQHLTTVLERDPANADATRRLRELFHENAPGELVNIYERIGAAHADAKIGARSWTRAAHIKLEEMADAQGAFFAAGRALARDAESAEALEVRADAAEAGGRPKDAAEALTRRLALPAQVALASDDAGGAGLRLRLGKLHAELGDAAAALPLLVDRLAELPPPLLLKLAPAARSLPAADSTRLHQRLLDAYPAPQAGGPTRAQLAEWTDDLARGHVALGRPEAALAAFKNSILLEPRNRAALRHVADLSSQRDPLQAIAAHRTLLDMTPPEVESLQMLSQLFAATGREDASFCAAAALVGLGLAQPRSAERALYDRVVAKPPPAELPRLADLPGLRAAGDEGAVRDLLAASAQELALALPTEMAGRASVVKGANPVRRICLAISRALDLPEPQLFLAKSEPGVVLAVATQPAGLLVGLEVPKRYLPRQQRFLYGRALAHLWRGTHPLAQLTSSRVAAVAGELIRLLAPPGTDLSHLPSGDAALGEALARTIVPQRREELAPLAIRAATELPTNWEPLTLGLRESAERVGLAVCGDPAAAISIVLADLPGGLDRPEVARLARFAVSEAYLTMRKGLVANA